MDKEHHSKKEYQQVQKVDTLPTVRCDEKHPQLRVFLLGPFRVEWLTPSQDPSAWESRTSARSLFKLLLCAPGRQASKAQLAGILWPESAEEKARESLRSATKVLGKVLTTITGEKLLDTSQRDLLKLADQSRLWVDVDAFELCVTQAGQYEDPKNAIALWQEAKELLGGTFLVDDHHQEWASYTWIKARRQSLLKARRKMIRSLADAYIGVGQLSAAEDLLSNHLIRFPTDQDALHRLLILLVQRGCPDEAIMHYEKLQRLLSANGKSLSGHITTFIDQLRGLLKGSGEYTAQTLLHASSFSFPATQLSTSRGLAELEGQDINTLHRQLMNVHQQQVLALPPFLNNSSVSHFPVGTPSTLQHTVSCFENTMPETLEQFASLTVHCQHLSEGNELNTAEQILWSYLPRVEDVVKFSFDSQQRAAEIASQGYLLAASLAGHRSNLWERKYYSEQALLYGKLAGDISLQMVALRQLAITFDCLQRPDLVLHISQQTFSRFQDVSPLLRACIYAGVSGAYAQLGQQQDALRFMELAYEYFPTNEDNEPRYLHTICRYSTLVFFDGLNYLEMNQPKKADEILAGIDGLHPKIQIPERVRIELLKYQVEVFLALNSMEQACVYLESAAKASLAIGSQRHFQESFQLFLQMQQKWKTESQIQQLADLFL